MTRKILQVLAVLILICIIWRLYYPSVIREMQVFPYVDVYKCRDTVKFYGGLQTIMCIKPIEIDAVISKSINQSGAFEGMAVSTMVKAMSIYPEAVFLDVGSNIGMYSVTIAAAKHRVVAVDALLENLAYVHHSVVLGGNRQNVRLVNNPVSDVRESYIPVHHAPDSANPGATFLVQAKTFDNEYTAVGPPTVSSITFMDLLNFIGSRTIIAKLDAEGFECKIMYEFLHHKNPGYFLPYILMEWTNVQTNLGSNCPNLEVLVDGLLSNHYTPYRMYGMYDAIENSGDPGKLEVLGKDNLASAIDILWVHRDAKSLF